MQIVSEQTYANNYKPHFEWANIKYEFTPDISVRVGQIVLPTFLDSDIRKVGFANPWVRPPLEVYALLPITNSDGIDASYRLHIGNVANTLQSHLGEASADLPHRRGAGDGKRIWGVTDITEVDYFTFHLSYQEMHLTLSAYDPLFQTFNEFGRQGVAITEQENLDSKVYVTESVGAVYDPGRWFVMAEWGRADTHSLHGVGSGGYVTGGCRWGKFTPYATYAKLDWVAKSAELNLAGLTPALAKLGAGLNATLNAALENDKESTASLGLRWDFFKNIDLKIQADRTHNGAHSPGNLTDLQPDFTPGRAYDLFSATVDVVF